MKLVAKKDLNAKEVRDYVDEHDVMVLQQMQDSRQPRREPPAKTLQFVTHVDIETGVAMHQECRMSDLRAQCRPCGSDITAYYPSAQELVVYAARVWLSQTLDSIHISADIYHCAN